MPQVVLDHHRELHRRRRALVRDAGNPDEQFPATEAPQFLAEPFGIGQRIEAERPFGQSGDRLVDESRARRDHEIVELEARAALQLHRLRVGVDPDRLLDREIDAGAQQRALVA